MPGVYFCQLHLLNQSLNLCVLTGDKCDRAKRVFGRGQRALILTRECAVETCFVSGSTS